MEKGEERSSRPADRIGQLTMRNLDIADTRDKLRVYARRACSASGGGRRAAARQRSEAKEVA